MEKIYDPATYSASEHINIKKLFTDFSKSLKKYQVFNGNASEDDEDDFSSALKMLRWNLPTEAEKFLVESCSVKQLDIDKDIQPFDIKGESFSKVVSLFKPFQGSTKLQTIRAINKLPISERTIRNKLLLPSLDIPCPVDDKSKIDLSPGKEVVIMLTVMKPYKYQFAQSVQKGRMRFFKTIMVLGSNTIADFRDMIDCPADGLLCQEVSENPDFDQDYPSSKKLYPSGFIFIDGIFYNDFRDENSIDYSEVIRKWALEKKIANFTTSDMASTIFDELTPRVGYPYVYQHKSCCEHIFMFSQIRLINSDDSLCSSNYPYCSKIARAKGRYCIICGLNIANWTIVDCDRLPQNNAPVCTICFKSYNYIDGKKIGNFKAYPCTTFSDI